MVQPVACRRNAGFVGAMAIAAGQIGAAVPLGAKVGGEEAGRCAAAVGVAEVDTVAAEAAAAVAAAVATATVHKAASIPGKGANALSRRRSSRPPHRANCRCRTS